MLGHSSGFLVLIKTVAQNGAGTNYIIVWSCWLGVIKSPHIWNKSYSLSVCKSSAFKFKSFQQAVLQNGRCMSKIATSIRSQVVIQRESFKTCTKLARRSDFFLKLKIENIVKNFVHPRWQAHKQACLECSLNWMFLICVIKQDHSKSNWIGGCKCQLKRWNTQHVCSSCCLPWRGQNWYRCEQKLAFKNNTYIL